VKWHVIQLTTSLIGEYPEVLRQGAITCADGFSVSVAINKDNLGVIDHFQFREKWNLYMIDTILL